MAWSARIRDLNGDKHTEIEEGQRTASKSGSLFKEMQGQKRLRRKFFGRLPQWQNNQAHNAHHNHRDNVLVLPTVWRIGRKRQGHQDQRDGGRQKNQTEHVQVIPGASNHIEHTTASTRFIFDEIEPSGFALI